MMHPQAVMRVVRKPAVYQLVVTGGKRHNEEGRFCSHVAKHLFSAVAESLQQSLCSRNKITNHAMW